VTITTPDATNVTFTRPVGGARQPRRDAVPVETRARTIAIGNDRTMSSHAESSPEPQLGRPTEPAVPPTPPDVSKTLEKSRTGYTWIGLIAAALIGIVVLIFILQNLEGQQVHLLFWSFSLPVGILVLLSVIAGALVMALVGGVRIVQLRRAVKR
jgi:uncharacterized integral membrane protein